jgi:SET domain-containing protein
VNWFIIEKRLYVWFSRHKDFNLFSLSFIDQGDVTLTHI